MAQDGHGVSIGVRVLSVSLNTFMGLDRGSVRGIHSPRGASRHRRP